MKTILATGELGTLKQIYQASLVAMMAGSDFIKTSTGKEPVNATLEVSLVMCGLSVITRNGRDQKSDSSRGRY